MSENTTDKAMRLNTIAPAEGAKHAKRRVGRGIGSGIGKTAGRGHKGQKSRSGGFHKVGFEGGQMPLHRRLPKRGFTAPFAKFNAEIRLSDLQRLPIDEIKSGELSRKITLRGVAVTAGAKAAIEAAGGNVIIDPPVEKPKKLPSKRV